VLRQYRSVRTNWISKRNLLLKELEVSRVAFVKITLIPIVYPVPHINESNATVPPPHPPPKKRKKQSKEDNEKIVGLKPIRRYESQSSHC